MIYIYNERYASEQSLYEKTVFGALELARGFSRNYVFVDQTHLQPTIIIVAVDAVTDVPDYAVKDIINQYKKHPNNKIIIDTAIEDFVTNTFHNLYNNLIEAGVEPINIAVITSQICLPSFIHRFNVQCPVYNVNMFEMYYYFFLHKNLENTYLNELLTTPIKPRKLDKHFISFKKNARFLRRMFHIHMKSNNYHEKAFYSWFGTPGPIWNADIERYNNITGKKLSTSDAFLENINTVYEYSDVRGNLEWFVPEEVYTTGGINLVHETHFSLDVDRDQPIDHKTPGLMFLTEKTYKNFVYGIPFLNPGVPGSEQMLSTFGYRAWDSMFNITTTTVDYRSSIKAYCNLIDEIANMSLNDLEGVLNDSASLEMIKQNRETFIEQKEFQRLCNLLDIISDK